MKHLSGAALDEHRTFVGMQYDAVGKPFTEADYDSALRTAFGEPWAGRVRNGYPTSAFPSPALAWATVITDRMWARGTQAMHSALARHVPVYAYEFADREAPMFLPLPGAPHGPGLPACLPHRPGVAGGPPYTQSLAPRRIGPVDYHRTHHLGFWSRMP
ncbi:hypothetical protein AB0A69_32340 [Streptomyces sp. NPDC045431]|uniref:hypothetical protein n=1 Tax=Streptomyces sp. NPDC045431 TaxID=3155613 RepID=UPI0033D5FDAF